MKIQKTKTNFALDSIFKQSLDELVGVELITRYPRKIMSYFPLFDITNTSNYFIDDELIPLKRVDIRKYTLIGVDSSLLPIAESMEGILYAVRGSFVVYTPKEDKYRINVLGPSLIYYTKTFVKEIARYVKISLKTLNSSIYDTYLAKKVLISLYEFQMLYNLAEKFRDSIIIYDGSLKSPILRDSLYNILLETLYQNNVRLIGVSKRSRLVKKYFEYLISLKQLGVDSFVKIDLRKFFSITFVGYLRVSSGMPFRVDISRNSPIDALNVLYSLPSNGFGYPSVLIEAHTISKLKYRDVLALYYEIISRGGKVKHSIPHRSSLLGPLEGGDYETF